MGYGQPRDRPFCLINIWVRKRYRQPVTTATQSFWIDHLHNYGSVTRFAASSARIDCDVCVSHSSCRFSSAFECRLAITMVFIAVLIEAGLVLYCSLIVFRVKWALGALVTYHSSGWLMELPRPQQHGRIHRARPPKEKVQFMLVPKSLWTLPLTVVWNRVRLDTSRK